MSSAAIGTNDQPFDNRHSAAAAAEAPAASSASSAPAASAAANGRKTFGGKKGMPPESVHASNLGELYAEAARLWGRRPAFATRGKSKIWSPTTFEELYEMGACLGTALIDLGVEARENVALIADNRLEWIIADCAIQIIGAADVPRGADVTDGDITYIIPHSDAKVCFVEHLELWKKIDRNRGQLGNIKHFILMHPDQAAPEGVLHMKDLIARGRTLREAGDRNVEARTAGIQPDDLCTLIYTSGTTGAPKGVMLTHRNMLYSIDKVPVDIGVNDRILSILPVWHIFERVFEVLAVARGACTYYTNVRNLGDDLKNVQPTFMGSAPRLWESLFLRILDGVQRAHPMRRFLFHTGYGLAEIYKNSTYYLWNRKLRMHKPNPVLFAMGWVYHLIRWLLITPLYGFFNVAVLERIRQGVGASLKGTVSGGGALPQHVDEFFNYSGIPVLEGYGMTETAAAISVRTAEKLIVGTVGEPISGLEIEITDLGSGERLYPNPNKPNGGVGLKGEIHVRGPQVMKGYYKNPEATAKTLNSEGWLNTGDVGMITFNGCLKIMGRSKDTVVLAGGENVEPVPIENKLQQSPLIDQVMVVGQDQKYLAALIVPSLEGLASEGREFASLADVAESKEAMALIESSIKREVNAEQGFKSFERVVDFRVVPKAFEVGDELTNLFKLKRHVITEKYQYLIDDIYK